MAKTKFTYQVVETIRVITKVTIVVTEEEQSRLRHDQLEVRAIEEVATVKRMMEDARTWHKNCVASYSADLLHRSE